MKPAERLIVALDVDTKERAIALVERLKSDVRLFKVGSELFTSCGPEIVAAVKSKGCGVFLDLKFHDIPNTVARAVTVATRLGVSIMNVHALGGYDMMNKAAWAAREEAERLKIEKPKLIAVTILTSMDENSLKKTGVNDTMEKAVLRLTSLAKDAGLDGVVASPSEVRSIRRGAGDNFVIIAPGVRPSWADANDQKRVATPKEAVLNGATYIVVGRPITEVSDPLEAARRILEDINEVGG